MIQSQKTSSRSLDDDPCDNLKVLQVLAQGLTSEVMKCRIKNKFYAIKVFKKEIKIDFRKNEIAILDQLDHNNIVSMIYYDEHKQTDWLVTELLFEKDLFDFVVIKKAPFDQKISRYIFGQLLQAVEHVHNKGISHRDLKLENILFSPDDFTLKLCDFGFSTMDNRIIVRRAGTDGYMAPELYEDDKLINFEDLFKTDIFALGVILFILLFSCPLFLTTNPQKSCLAWKAIQQKKWDFLWKKIEKRNGVLISSDIRSLLEGMLNPKPKKRWTLKQIIESEFMEKDISTYEEYYLEMQERAKIFNEQTTKMQILK